MEKTTLPSVDELYELDLDELTKIKLSIDPNEYELEDYLVHLEFQIKERQNVDNLVNFFISFDLSSLSLETESRSLSTPVEKNEEKVMPLVSEQKSISNKKTTFKDILARTKSIQENAIKVGRIELPVIKRVSATKNVKKEREVVNKVEKKIRAASRIERHNL